MRILISIDYFQPQLGYSEAYLVTGLSKLGHEVKVFTSDHYFPFPSYKDTVGKELGPRKLKSGQSKWGGADIYRQKMIFEAFSRAIFFGQHKVIKSFKPEIVIANKVAGFSTFIFAFLKNTYGYKLVCYDSHLPSEIELGSKVAKSIFYWFFRKVFSPLVNSRVDKFIAVQEDTVKVMRSYYGIRKNVNNIPLGTDIRKFFFSRIERNRLREKLRIDRNDFVLVYTGKIIESKGLDILFKAFSTLREKHFNVRLLLVGSGTDEYLSYCFSMVNEKYRRGVIYTGFQKNELLYKYYSASDVAIWPLQESTSMNDAASCKLPFIANNDIGARIRVSNNNALLYRRGDYMDLANKIEFLYKNPRVRKRMGNRGRELVEKRLSWDQIVHKYIEV